MVEQDPSVATIRDGLTVLPLRTPTLPPATHTNTVLVGYERVWIVDPATPHDDQRRRLLDVLDDHAAQGRIPHAIVLTHHHPDHVGAAAWLSGERALPIHAHATTRMLLSDHVPVHETLAEGDVLAGSGRPDDQWHVLHTPGHASGHIVLWQPERRALIGGDMVAAVGTIIIEPPDGHMATYITQLQRLASLEPEWLVPAHGQVIEAPVAHLQ
ncbi:MAG: MBL fold metallo-hydrolase, partial [Myxococcota bacterium]|nr:MBL fold metallo-hydrolase [Myxococcota bacterium]